VASRIISGDLPEFGRGHRAEAQYRMESVAAQIPADKDCLCGQNVGRCATFNENDQIA
jgi:hypothetical protein